jgi:hypothetical protein
MWARWCEILIGVWLVSSYWLFRASWTPPSWPLYANEFAASLIVTFALASYWHPLRHAHLGNVAIAMALVAVGWLDETFPASASDQNRILTGLALMMFAVVPNHATKPPEEWRRVIDKH